MSIAFCVISCKPEGASPQSLSLLMMQNDKLRDSVATMEATISQSGEHDPLLLKKIQQTEQDLARDIRELTALRTKNNQDEIRRLELEQRLETFEKEFNAMQREASQMGAGR